MRGPGGPHALPPLRPCPASPAAPAAPAAPTPSHPIPPQVNFDNARFHEYILRADTLTLGLKAQLAAAGVAPPPPAQRLPW
jgi:hypothetical protein